MTDRLLEALSVYGLPVLFLIISIAAVGVPFPVSFLLVAAGSFVEQGEMQFVPVLLVAGFGALLGDNVGYFLARWGGRDLLAYLSRTRSADAKVKSAQKFSQRWGDAGIFFSRWLVTALGPWVNLTSGVAHYPWPRFLLWDVIGELLWVTLYVGLGYVFSDRVQTITDLIGNFTWTVLGLLLAVYLGWKVLQYFRDQAPVEEREASAG